MRTGPIVREDGHGEPIAWVSWSAWRRGRRDPWSVWVRPIEAPCAWCWGQRKILEPGPLGLIPVVCEDCGGTGMRAAA
jgi:hypothetical protein